MILAAAVVFILMGVLFFFLGYVTLASGHFVIGMNFIIVGLFIILFGLLIPPLAKKQVRAMKDNDGYVKVKAPLATKDLSAPEVVKKFLRENDYSYEFKENNTRQRMEKKYVLDRGNYINLIFIRTQRNPPTYSGWLEFGYKFSNYVESRKLQRELDEYLTERGILLKKS